MGGLGSGGGWLGAFFSSGTVNAACTGAAGAGFGAADSAAKAWANRDPKKTASAVPPAAVTVVAPTTRRRPAARGSTA